MRPGFAYMFSLIVFIGCGGAENNKNVHDHAAAEKKEQYTCSMHPQIIQDAPGTCPICGMDLVKVTNGGASGNKVMLNDQQIRLANITTRAALKKPVGETMILNGSLTVDKEKSKVISTRAAGRVEKLFIKETGQAIGKGQPLYVLYSESLLTLQQEYLLAKEQYERLGGTEKRYQSFLEAAGRKLLLYGLTENQIARLTGKDALQSRITFLAPASGIVTGISASEGQYLSEGAVLYRIEDIGSLWVEAELYPDETSLVKKGDKIALRVNGFESSPIQATVSFLSPEYRDNSQIVIMRAEIKNPESKFMPGQQVQVFLTHSTHTAIALPVDAVIRDGKGSHVYVQTGANTFEPRMVKTGLEGFDSVEITEGLQEGDTVAVTGAYLLYAEIILKKGSSPMAGHVH